MWFFMKFSFYQNFYDQDYNLRHNEGNGQTMQTNDEYVLPETF